jgi:hypothetical protein
MTTDEDKSKSLFKQLLRGHVAGERVEVEETGLAEEMAMLREWQANRLRQTYDDLLHSPKYGRACAFFLTDIYGARDFSQRDADAENAYNSMRKYLPERLLSTLSKAIELNNLTQELDAQLLDVLVHQLGVSDEMTIAQYAEAYRICDNYGARAYQIDLLMELGSGLDNLIRIPMIGLILRAARRPAIATGWGELQGFLERGFAAFKEMGQASPFLQIVEERERAILDRIFAADPNPFD